MALFNRKQQQQATPAAPLTVPARPTTDWSKLDNVRNEWPRAALDPAADLQKLQDALTLYERNDYGSMMRCATLFATTLAHSLYGPGFVKGDDLPETVRKTLYCSLCPSPDGRTFAESAQKAARLALTIMRENGWQPPSFGGTMTFFEPMVMDKGNYILLGTAIAQPGQPWTGDLKAFFSVTPTPLVEALPDAEAERGRDTVDRLYDTLQQSKAGDTASSLNMDGMALALQGDSEGAVAKYSEAANLGSVDAMASAGDLTSEMGRLDESRFWYESAANAGHPVGMFNTAISAIQDGDRAKAQHWFQRSAEAGNSEGYAALTQLADEAGEDAAEAHWARLGTEAGQLFCMGRHGLLLARGANDDVPTMRRARDVLEQAADRGHLDSAALAVNLNHQLGDPARAQRFVSIVVQSGDAEAIDRLRRYGFL
jgi:TPR repeat protein